MRAEHRRAVVHVGEAHAYVQFPNVEEARAFIDAVDNVDGDLYHLVGQDGTSDIFISPADVTMLNFPKGLA